MSSQDGACSSNSKDQQKHKDNGDNKEKSKDRKNADDEIEMRDYTDDEDIDLSYQQLSSCDLFQLTQDWKGSLVEYYGPNSSYCGYCKIKEEPNTNGRKSFDMQSYRLTPSDYQDLLDRGWRRSGKYCYCPVNKSTCCPNYPIICKTTEFKFTWSQRRCIENLNSFLMTGKNKERVKLSYANNDSDIHLEQAAVNADLDVQKHNRAAFALLRASSKARDRRFVQSCERKVKLQKISLNEAIKQTKAKWMVRQPKIPSLENFLFPCSSSLVGCDLGDVDVRNPKHKLRIKMSHVESKLCIDSRSEEHSIMVKYQKVVHGEELKEWTMSRYSDFLVSSPLITEPLRNFAFVSNESGSSSSDVSDDLSKKAHSKSDFILVEPPELPTAFGTYHCIYYLDEKMIAVGVLDVLPGCITTVYLFYDPEYSFLNLGIYSALVEISMVRQMHKYYTGSGTNSDNKLIYYHLGYYVHECKKMYYKTRFRPSYMLCSKTFRYVPTDICLKRLRGEKYAPFLDEESSSISHRATNTLERLLEIPISSHVIPKEHKLVHYLRWIELNYGDEFVDLLVDGYLITYAQLIGPKLVPKLCLRLNAVHRTLTDRYRHLEKEKEQKKTA